MINPNPIAWCFEIFDFQATWDDDVVDDVYHHILGNFRPDLRLLLGGRQCTSEIAAKLW